ncbi:16850_t:CDS:2 [Cetraspora pellucida]|uniref:16850_t:CDS:1 n=1 Tax=Cetraspora pellucida TaxID=1433469 RepID=A0ACA9LAE7_9GLOM|nr:16850_t:CDS:2 [Cetraspora pellucida]
MLEEQPIDKPSIINTVENDAIICVDSPSPDTYTNQVVIEDEETLMEGFVPISQSPSTTPLNSPSQNFNSIPLLKKLDKRPIESSDSILDIPSKKSKDYTESVARGYLCLAKFREWKNNDGSYFPISVINLCNYLRVKMLTNNIKSLDWNINALGKYQKNVLNIQNWNDVRFHQDVRDLLNQIRKEKMSNVKKVNEINANGEDLIKKMKGRDSSVLSSSSGSSSPSPTPLLSDNRKKKRLTRSKSAYDRMKPSSNDQEIIQNFDSASVAPFPFPQMQVSDVDLPYESMISLLSTQDDVDVSSTSIDFWKGVGVSNEIIQEDEAEPESFKSCYERSLSILKSLYANHCSFHPDGCVLLPDDLHFVLSDTHYRRWALLCASGDDVVETDLPVAEELDEFSKKHAVKV